MNYALDIHDDKSLDDLLEYFQNFFNREVFLLFVVAEEVTFSAIFHGNL